MSFSHFSDSKEMKACRLRSSKGVSCILKHIIKPNCNVIVNFFHILIKSVLNRRAWYNKKLYVFQLCCSSSSTVPHSTVGRKWKFYTVNTISTDPQNVFCSKLRVITSVFAKASIFINLKFKFKTDSFHSFKLLINFLISHQKFYQTTSL